MDSPIESMAVSGEAYVARQPGSWLLAALGIAAISGVVLVYCCIFYRQIYGSLDSDIPEHIQHIREFSTGVRPVVAFPMVISYPMLAYGVLAISALTRLDLDASTMMVLMLSVCAAGIILAAMFDRQVGRRYSWPAIAIVISAMFCVSGIHLPALNPFIYFGTGSPNLIHNPTAILSKPFCFILILLFHRLTAKKDGSLSMLAALTSLAAMLCVFSKPNFALAFIFSAPLYLLCIGYWRMGWKSVALVTSPILVLVVVLGMQYLLQYGAMKASAMDESKIVFDLLGVASLYNKHVVLSMGLLIAFPLSVAIAYPSILKDGLFRLASLTFVVAVAQYWTLAESGYRYRHGNLGWGLEITLPFVFVLCLAEMMKRMKTDKGMVARGKTAAVALVFLAHVASGLMYFRQLLTTASYN